MKKALFVRAPTMGAHSTCPGSFYLGSLSLYVCVRAQPISNCPQCIFWADARQLRVPPPFSKPKHVPFNLISCSTRRVYIQRFCLSETDVRVYAPDAGAKSNIVD